MRTSLNRFFSENIQLSTVLKISQKLKFRYEFLLNTASIVQFQFPQKFFLWKSSNYANSYWFLYDRKLSKITTSDLRQ